MDYFFSNVVVVALRQLVPSALTLFPSPARAFPLATSFARGIDGEHPIGCTEAEKTLIIQGTRARAIAIAALPLPCPWQHRLSSDLLSLLHVRTPSTKRTKGTRAEGHHAHAMHAYILLHAPAGGSVPVLSPGPLGLSPPKDMQPSKILFGTKEYKIEEC